MGKKRFGPLALVLTAAVTLCITLGGVLLFLGLTVGREGLALVQGLGYLNTFFVGERQPEVLADAALTGMVAATEDRWSYYMTAAGYDSQSVRWENRYVGIGVTVAYTDARGLLVQEVTPDGPAAGAGIVPGELIVAADGQSLAGEARRTGAELIQGEAGSTVTLEVLGTDNTTRTVSVVRAAVITSSVRHSLLENGLGYVQVANFYQRTAQDFRAAVTELQEQGATGLIFDMRNNGGGYLAELTDMLDLLLPEGPIFRSTSRNGREEVVRSDADAIDLPMAVLVNANTYSAAEMFAAELQEWGAAVVAGEKTTGKGRSQQTFPLVNGGALNFSTQSYFTGDGRSLTDTGVTPDLPVAEAEGRDAPRDAAAAHLLGE